MTPIAASAVRPLTALRPAPMVALARAAADEPRTRLLPPLPPWIGRTIFGVGVVALVVWLVGPIVWIVISSFQPEGAITSVPLRLVPEINTIGYERLLSNPAGSARSASTSSSRRSRRCSPSRLRRSSPTRWRGSTSRARAR